MGMRLAAPTCAVLLCLAALPSQSPELVELEARDWRVRNAATARLCAEARRLPRTDLEELWGIATDGSELVGWAAPRTRQSASQPLIARTVLPAVELDTSDPDFVPQTAADLVVAFSPQALATLVLIHSAEEPTPARRQLAVELATKTASSPEFELACALVASLGKAAVDEVRSRLAAPPGSGGDERPLLAAARILAHLGPAGRQHLCDLFAIETPEPTQRAALLAMQEPGDALAADALAAVARLVRHRPAVAGTALGTLVRHAAAVAFVAAVRELAEGARGDVATERQRCLAALAQLRLRDDARAIACAAAQAALEAGVAADLPLAIAVLHRQLCSPLGRDCLDRLRALAADPTSTMHRVARACLLAAAAMDDGVSTTLVHANADFDLDLLRQALQRNQGHGGHQLTNEPFLTALRDELRSRSGLAYGQFLRDLGERCPITTAPTLTPLLRRELACGDPQRIDAAAQIVARHARALGGLTEAVELLALAPGGASRHVGSAWVRLRPEHLPAALAKGLVTADDAWRFEAAGMAADLDATAALLANDDAKVRYAAAAWLSSLGAPAADWLARMASGRESNVALWGLRGLRNASVELRRDAARCDALERTLRGALAGRNRNRIALTATAALQAIARLEAADLELVMREVHALAPEPAWQSAGPRADGTIDVRTLVTPWTVQGVLDAIDATGTTPATLFMLEELGELPAAGVMRSHAEELCRYRRLRGKLAQRR